MEGDRVSMKVNTTFEQTTTNSEDDDYKLNQVRKKTIFIWRQ